MDLPEHMVNAATRHLSEAIGQRAIDERVRAQFLKIGTVTAIDAAAAPPKVRLGGRLMTILFPEVAVGDRVAYFDLPDPLAIGKIPIVLGGGGGGVPKIWVAPTLDLGATTWRAADGDTRTLTTQAARHTTKGGVIAGPNTLNIWAAQGGYQIDDDLPTPGKVRLDIDLSTWWSLPGGGVKSDYSQPYFYDWNFAFAVVHQNWYDTGDPSMIAVTDGAASPNANGILLDPSSVGASGYDRLFLRIDFFPATGACEAWLAAIDDVTFNLVSQGTATFGIAQAGSAIEFGQDTAVFGPGPYPGWSPYVVHGMQLRYSSSGGGNGRIVHGWQINGVDQEAKPHTFGRPTPGHLLLGNSQLQEYGGLFYQQYDTDFAISPKGAPIFLPDFPNGTMDNIFTGGDDLADPAIAASPVNDPGHIQIFDQQPHAFTGNGVDDAWFVHAIVDRSTGDLDSNGWPIGWWPFGPLMA